jgi:threonine synthase
VSLTNKRGFVMIISCGECGQQQQLTPQKWRCDCGGAWEPVEQTTFTVDQIRQHDFSIWRYQDLFGLDFAEPVTRLGAGWTPLIPTTVNERLLHLKLEYFAPTGSFKDRGVEMMINILAHQGVDWVVEDSSGNAGAAVAAYAAAAGMRAGIYVPAYASKNKQAQIALYGAAIHPIPGKRVDSKYAAINATNDGAVYASHAYHPGFYLGQQSLAWELWEQLGQKAPDWVIVPVGQGVQLLGIWSGFQRLFAAGLINSVPKMIGVQPERCAPLAAAIQTNAETVEAFNVTETSAAEGVMIAQPIRGKRLLQAIRESGGTCLTVNESAIKAGQKQLAHQGIYIEPTSATVIAALDAVKQLAAPEDVIVASLTGSGLKGSPTMNESPK